MCSYCTRVLYGDARYQERELVHHWKVRNNSELAVVNRVLCVYSNQFSSRVVDPHNLHVDLRVFHLFTAQVLAG